MLFKGCCSIFKGCYFITKKDAKSTKLSKIDSSF